eukprot:TRINITY_DN6377_c0_g1_i1.p1 TRINITY_DN6377_c0_g1~~TRINITY_DN6377_c0_g1_i1.p1  ORF type:complete len:183 (+),score=23.70 TRINITY_DN6377_c0_g1_i1:130-678(+)
MDQSQGNDNRKGTSRSVALSPDSQNDNGTNQNTPSDSKRKRVATKQDAESEKKEKVGPKNIDPATSRGMTTRSRSKSASKQRRKAKEEIPSPKKTAPKRKISESKPIKDNKENSTAVMYYNIVTTERGANKRKLKPRDYIAGDDSDRNDSDLGSSDDEFEKKASDSDDISSEDVPSSDSDSD